MAARGCDTLGTHGDAFTLKAPECLALAQVDGRSMVGWLMTRLSANDNH